MRCLAFALVSGLLASSAGAQIGTVLQQHKISSTSGGFAGPLSDGDRFGYALATLGDVNGDGVVDLAVGAPYDAGGGLYRGAVWILFLDPAGGVRSATKISAQTGFPLSFVDYGLFGYSLAPLGDLDGDAIPDLAIGAPGMQTVWFCMLRRDGTVRSAPKTDAQDVIYNPPINPGELLGRALAPLGDIDSNGVQDLALTAPNAGASPGTVCSIWILRLTRFGTIGGAQRSVTNVGGTGPLAGWHYGDQLAVGDLDGDGDFDFTTGGTRIGPSQNFSLLTLVLDSVHNLVRVDETRPGDLNTYLQLPQDAGGIGGLQYLGDLDGDGGPELALGAPRWRPSPDVVLRRGALIVGFMRSSGPARRAALVASNEGGLVGRLPADSAFGSAFAPLGDLDGDGVGDLAVGAPVDPDGGPERGAVWILNLDGSALRNGSGANPQTLSEVAPPVMARNWQVDLDCSAHGSGFGVLAGYTAGQAGFPSPAGEVLVDPASIQLFRFLQAHAGGVARFAMPVPVDLGLINLPLHLQGLCVGPPGPQLSNALDEVLSVP